MRPRGGSSPLSNTAREAARGHNPAPELWSRDRDGDRVKVHLVDLPLARSAIKRGEFVFALVPLLREGFEFPVREARWEPDRDDRRQVLQVRTLEGWVTPSEVFYWGTETARDTK